MTKIRNSKQFKKFGFGVLNLFRTSDLEFRASNRGIGLVEALVGAAVITIFISSLVIAYNQFLKHSFATVRQTQAAFLAEEGLEAVKSIRDQGWDANIETLTEDEEYHIVFSGLWQATTTAQIIDNIFTRTFVIEDVYRDADDDIASSGTLDPDTKKVTVTVSWQSNSATSTKSVATYITNLHDN